MSLAKSLRILIILGHFRIEDLSRTTGEGGLASRVTLEGLLLDFRIDRDRGVPVEAKKQVLSSGRKSFCSALRACRREHCSPPESLRSGWWELPEEPGPSPCAPRGSAWKTSLSRSDAPISRSWLMRLESMPPGVWCSSTPISMMDMRSSSRWRYLGEIFSNHSLHLAS